MVCRLCLQEKELIKAHVIPKFLFKDIFEGKKVIEANLNNLKQRTVKQDAAYDYNLLCKDCDSLIGKYETYAANAIYKREPTECELLTNPDCDTIIYKNIEFKRFKLFLLSFLWRASVSKIALFNGISLGNKHEENLRVMIYYGEPGDIEDYPCWMFKIDSTVNRYTSTILTPMKLKDNAHTSYIFTINSFFYWFSISPVNIPDFIMKSTIDKNNEIAITNLKGENAMKIVDNIFRLRVPLVKKSD